MQRPTIALLLSIAACGPALEYRVAGPLSSLAPGAEIALRGQLIGEVSRLEERGETTFVHLRLIDRSHGLHMGDAVRLRRMGLSGEPVLEIVRARPKAPQLPAGAWLQLLPEIPRWPNELSGFRARSDSSSTSLSPFQLIPLAPVRPRRSVGA
jgi:hypothetical protein